MADDPTDEPTPDEPAEPTPESLAGDAGVGTEYVDPEPDEEENGADLVQLVRTGWVRLVIGGHGRVRFRPPRFGELRAIMVAHEALVDEVQERAHDTQALAETLNAELAAMTEPGEDGTVPEVSPEARHKALVDVTLRSRKANRELTRWREEQFLTWWGLVHETLGVSGETLPPVDGLPVWMSSAALASSVILHWQAVPLDRGRK